MLDTLDILRWFVIARRLDRENDRARLEARKEKLIGRLMRRVLPRSPYYASLAHGAFSDLPIMDKTRWMAAFDSINTAGVRLSEALDIADRAERTRDFAPTIKGLTVGLSTGTSGRRGVFLVSRSEQRRWAGVMLAKLLHERPFARRRVAFFLRANSRLYEQSGGFRRIAFRFFDMLESWEKLLDDVQAFAPDVLIAPASALRLMAEAEVAGRIALAPEMTISVAETLHVDDRRLIEHAFGSPPAEVYQATEGALAMTCERGVLHLNEAFVHFEMDWLDRAGRRFAPIVTDLTRATQPIVRYRLDDVLILSETPCPCARAALSIEAVEGRCDDICSLVRADGGVVPAFPDLLVRAVLGASADIADFTLTQSAPGRFEIALRGGVHAEAEVVAALARLAAHLGALAPAVSFARYAPNDGKRRRVRRTDQHGVSEA
jgi:putative adenylate-forming enzyme